MDVTKIKTCLFVIFFLVLMLGLSGCEKIEELNKPDYITVSVTCNVNAVLFPHMESMDDPQMIPAKDLKISVEIIKAGGERVSEVVSTDASGKTAQISALFKLYREQPISCIANVVYDSANADFPEYTFNGDSQTILWNEIYPTHDFGDQVSKTVTLNVYGMYNDQ